MEWHSIVIMHKSQSPDMSPEQLFAELGGHAFAVCELFECMEHWPELPAGTLIAMQPCLAIAGLFLPHQPNHNMWLRQKFAMLEAQGYVYLTYQRGPPIIPNHLELPCFITPFFLLSHFSPSSLVLTVLN
jgi:hypothetical protein